MSIDESAGRVRASDAEREHYARLVREATGEGRLTLDEGDERLGLVYAVRFRDELPGLVADLPAPPPSRPGGPGSTVDGRPAVGRRVHYRPYGPRFGVPLGGVVFVTLLLAGVWALASGHFFWPVIPLVFFGVILLRRARWRR